MNYECQSLGYLPERSVTPHLCLPLNQNLLREQAHGWCREFIDSSSSVGKTVAPPSLVSSTLAASSMALIKIKVTKSKIFLDLNWIKWYLKMSIQNMLMIWGI